jgi:hypothetical protein
MFALTGPEGGLALDAVLDRAADLKKNVRPRALDGPAVSEPGEEEIPERVCRTGRYEIEAGRAEAPVMKDRLLRRPKAVLRRGPELSARNGSLGPESGFF